MTGFDYFKTSEIIFQMVIDPIITPIIPIPIANNKKFFRSAIPYNDF